MESHQQNQSVKIEMEKLNEEQCAEPVPPQISSSLKRAIILVSVMVLLAVISTFLLFHFVFRQDCAQKVIEPTPNTSGKVNITCRPRETPEKRYYEIFKAEKYGKYLIHGWLRRNDVNETVKLVHLNDNKNRTLQKNNISEDTLFFGVKVTLFKNSRVHLESSPYTDSFFHVYEL